MSEFLIHRVFGYVEQFENSLNVELERLLSFQNPPEDTVRHYRARLSAVKEIREFVEDVIETEA